MFRPVALVDCPAAGRLEPVRLGVRVGDPSCLELTEGVPKAGPQRAGAVEIDLVVRGLDGAAMIDATLRNTEARPVPVSPSSPNWCRGWISEPKNTKDDSVPVVPGQTQQPIRTTLIKSHTQKDA